jgi:hypothetical protein
MTKRRYAKRKSRPVVEAAQRADRHAFQVKNLIEEARSLRDEGKENKATKLERIAEEEAWAAREAAFEAEELSQGCLEDIKAAWGVADAWCAASYAWEALHTGQTEV